MFFPQIIAPEPGLPAPATLPSISPFEKYRPSSHFIAPHSWQNDPCGALFIPETKEYILCYQWNPGTTEGGNSCWGMARSKDFVTWHDCVPALMNGINTKYDSCGVFSGSIISQLVDSRRVLYLFYTSISTFPYPHWSKSYTRQETQSVAFSTDFGRSWQRYQQNPLLVDAPNGLFTTGWRDPFVSEWENLSRLRGMNISTKYMLLASGDKRTGPQLFLYESQDLLDWRPLCVLLKGQANLPIAPGSDICHGVNFECASFFTLGGNEYLTFGVEQHPSQTKRHSSRYTLWISGKLILDGGGKPIFAISSFGRLDPGIMYAPHIFRGPKNELLQLGWADEEQNPTTKSQGWAGFLVYPRELCQIQLPIPNVHLINEQTWEIDSSKNTMTTLGIRPAPQMKFLRKGTKLHDLSTLSDVRSHTFEIDAKFTHLSGTELLTFNVRQAPNDCEVTRIIVSLLNSTISVNRSASSLTNGNPEPETGPFQLFNNGTAEMPRLEDLHVRIFVDNSIIEVYANDRFALSSRVYPTLETALAVSCDFRTAAGPEELEKGKVSLECWEGLVNAWPGRHLVQDEIVDMVNERANLTKVQITEAHLQAIVA